MPDTPGASPAPRRRGRKRRATVRLVLAAAVLAGAVWLTARLVAAAGWQEVAARLAAASPPWLAAAAALKVAVLVVWAARWRMAVRRLERTPGGWVLLSAQAVGVFANHVAPFARVVGGLVRVRYLRRFGEMTGVRALGLVLFDQIAHLVTMGALTAIALAAAAAMLGLTPVAAGMALALLAAAVVLAWRRHQGLSSLTAVLAARLTTRVAAGNGGSRLAAGAGAAAGVVAELAAVNHLWTLSLAMGGVLFVLNALSQWAIFFALGESVGLLVVIVVVAVGGAAGILTATPGGIGGTEAAMIPLFTALGVDPAAAAAGTLLFRAVHYAVVLAAGVPALLWLEWRLARRPRVGTGR